MKRVIYKFPVNEEKVEMPASAKILCVQTQRGEVYLWASIDPAEIAKEMRRFQVVGTGHEFDDKGMTYLGTVQQMGGSLIWHIFEAKP